MGGGRAERRSFAGHVGARRAPDPVRPAMRGSGRPADARPAEGARAAAIVVISGDLFGAGLTVICADSFGDLGFRRLPTPKNVRKLDRPEAVRLVVLDVDVVDRADLARTIEGLAEHLPASSIVVADMPSGRDGVLGHLAHGAHGVLFKTQSADEIAGAIRLVMQGGIAVPPVAGQEALHGSKPGRRAPGSPGLPAHLSDVRLTPRQRDVLDLLVQGLSNKGIARQLDVSEATVKVHCNAVFKALKVSNRASAVALVLSRRS